MFLKNKTAEEPFKKAAYVVFAFLFCLLYAMIMGMPLGVPASVRETLKMVTAFYGVDITLFGLGGILVASIAYINGTMSGIKCRIVEMSLALLGTGTLFSFILNDSAREFLKMLLLPAYILCLLAIISCVQFFVKNKVQCDFITLCLLSLVLVIALLCSPLPRFLF
ncbi:MAG TPA: hypothetical protein VEC36_14070 [Patescibacteria group bacterium]|nr:hypothetical protein [Patescibacteria group bacterium]